MPEAGSHLRTRLKTTSLHAESTTVNLQCGSPVAAPLTSGVGQAAFCGYMVNVRVSQTLPFLFRLLMSMRDCSGIGEEHSMVGATNISSSSSIHIHLLISSSIIEEVKALRNAGLGLMAYYYFDFTATAKQDVRGLVSSLVVQLSAKSDLCYDILSDLYSKHDAGSQLPHDDVLTRCLKDMLELPGQPLIYIIVDALDECPNFFGAPSPRELILDLIEGLVVLYHPNLRICVTSRPEADIQEALGSLV
jgi:hypothetical protein